jgi:pimeloyl-ACP methyl ester carboxylesterase
MKWFFYSIILLGLLHEKITAQSPKKNSAIYQEGYVEVGNDVKLFYQKIGEGRNKLIIPLGLYLYDGLKSLAETADRTIVFYDVRNRGRSSHLTDSTLIGIWQDVDDLEKVRKHFGFGKTSLIGWSYLGMMVMLYSSRYEKYVDRIVQIGPVPLKWDTKFSSEYTNTSPSLIDSNETKKIDQLLKEDYHRREPRKFTEKWFAANAPDLLGDASNLKNVLEMGPQITSNENEWYTNFRWHLYHHFFGL